MSPRNKRNRRIGIPPILKGFKPLGIPFHSTTHISIQYEEYEALRLADYENLTQEEASVKMNISRPTFTRIYESVRKKIAEAFVEGKAIVVEGGNVEFEAQWYRCNDCYTVFSSDLNKEIHCSNCQSDNIEHINESLQCWKIRKRGRKSAESDRSSAKFCVCPACLHKAPHIPGVPCKSIKCEKCGNSMKREW